MRIEAWYLGLFVSVAMPEFATVTDAELFLAVVLSMVSVTLVDVGRRRFEAYRDAVARRVSLEQSYELD